MAIRLPDGSIQMSDGRIIYANSIILGADLCEIIPLCVPPPAWPFISGGGGGGSGTPGARGANGAPGTPGLQGPQGTNPGVQGPQGNLGAQGNQGLLGAGVQGPQGNQGLLGAQGGQGLQGAQGNQGFTGNQGNQGNQGILGFQGNQGALNPDIFASTRVVSLTPGEGTDLTIAAAIAALPVEGGYIYVKQGTYPIAAPLTLPDKNVEIRGTGAILVPAGNITVFEIADGLTAVRTYKLSGLTIQGNPAASQTLLSLNDANNFGNYEIRDFEVTGIQTFVSWIQYDPTYSRQSNVFTYNTRLTAISGGSVLATTPNPANSYFSPVAIRMEQTILQNIVDAGVSYGWDADADMDFWCNQGQIAYIQAGFQVNGWMSATTSWFVYGTGEISAFGNGWDFNDFFYSSEVIAFDPATLVPVDVRINVPGSGIDGTVFFGGLRCTFIGWVNNCQFLDPIGGSAFPAVELLNQKSIVRGCVIRNLTAAFTGYPQGGVKLTNAVRCKVHDNFFEVTLIGHTVIETGTSDFNIIHDNTGYNNGTGPLIIGANTLQHDNIN